MKTLVLYSSKTGYTKKYASWIGEELGLEAKALASFDLNRIKDYELIIYGGGLYAGLIKDFSKVKKITNSYPDKHLVIFSTGLSSGNEEQRKAVMKANYLNKDNIKYFHLKSGIDYGKLGFFDKLIMKFLVSSLKKKPEEERDQDIKDIIDSYGSRSDFSDKEKLKPIIDYLESLK